MRDLNELNSYPSAARHDQPGDGPCVDPIFAVEVPHTFDRSLPTLVKQLEALSDAGLVTGTPAGDPTSPTDSGIETGLSEDLT